MRKLQKLFLFAGTASVMAFASCKKDDTKKDDPTTTVEDVKLTMTATPAGITSFGMQNTIIIHTVATGNSGNALVKLIKGGTVTIDGVTIPIGDTTVLTGTSYETYDTLTFDVYNAKFELGGVLTGEKGNPAVASLPSYYTCSIFDMSTPTTLGNQADAQPKFWSAKLNTTKFLADAKGNPSLQADLDFAYCSRSTANGGNKLIAPSSDDATAIYADQWSDNTEDITNWTTRNNTGFIKVNNYVSANDFNNPAFATDSLIAKARVGGEPSNPSVQVASNDIFLFRTIRGTTAYPIYYYGLIKVSAPTGSVDGSGTALAGNVTLTIRYEKEH